MTGTSLSRWTMAYFAVALLSLLLAEILMVVGYGYPADGLRAPGTLVVVHLTAIGWLSLLICGALFQFVPVLVNRPLAAARLALPALLSIVAGLAALVTGFLVMDGVLDSPAPFLPAGGTLLFFGFALVATTLGLTLARARPLPLPARYVGVGLACLLSTAALGFVFTQVLGGTTTLPLALDVAARGVPVHAVAGLGGWLAMCAIGVSYRLLPMFLLSPDRQGRVTRFAFLSAACALATTIGGGFAALLAGWSLYAALAVAGLAGIAAVALYAHDVVKLYRTRRRLELELNMRMALLAFGSLAVAVVLPVPLAAFAGAERATGAAVYLVAFGWLSGLGLAMLYKIVPFMTWLECYGPVLGRSPTPRVQDLVSEPRAMPWFLLYFASAWVGTAALALGSGSVLRGAASGMLVATGAIVLNLARARMLAEVAGEDRLPAGTRRPALLYSLAAGKP